MHERHSATFSIVPQPHNQPYTGLLVVLGLRYEWRMSHRFLDASLLDVRNPHAPANSPYPMKSCSLTGDSPLLYDN